MSRPKTYEEDRVSTSMRFNPDLLNKLRNAAEERGVSLNWLVNRGMEEYLERLIPVDELKWTRED